MSWPETRVSFFCSVHGSSIRCFLHVVMKHHQCHQNVAGMSLNAETTIHKESGFLSDVSCVITPLWGQDSFFFVRFLTTHHLHAALASNRFAQQIVLIQRTTCSTRSGPSAHDVDETGVWRSPPHLTCLELFFLPLQPAHDLRGIKVVFLLLCQ